jgi:stage II sporulation protein D
MNNKLLLLIVIILSIVALISSQNKTTFFNNDISINVKDDSKNEITNLLLEEYVIGVVAGEMPASFNEEALKAQAIAARSFAVNKINTTKSDFDVLKDKRSQVYITEDEMRSKWQDSFSKYYEKIKNAVLDTKGQVMKYNDEVISAYYFAMSNGMTEDVSLVFGNSKDYLKSVNSEWDKNIKNFEVTKNYSKEEFKKLLGIKDKEITIGKIEYSKTNRVNNITINNKKYKGTEIRKLLNLRSTDFKIDIKDKITITTRGYGHGVGMSQYGANEMAKRGYKYDEILKYYYQNIIIENILV